MSFPTRRAILLLLSALPAGPLASQEVVWDGGVSVSHGHYYFTDPTTTWTFSSGLAYRSGAWTFRAGLPVIMQNTTLLTSGIAGSLPTGGQGDGSRNLGDSSQARRDRKAGGGGGGGGGGGMASSIQPTAGVQAPAGSLTGYFVDFGDPTVQLGVSPRLGANTVVGLTGIVKAPISDHGSGEWDMGGSVALSQAFGHRMLLMLDAGYWHLGDMPGLDLQDPWLGSSSIAVLFGDGWAWSVTGSGSRSIVAEFEDSYTVGTGLMRSGRGGSFGVSGMFGLTQSAPDYTIGVSWQLGLGAKGRE